MHVLVIVVAFGLAVTIMQILSVLCCMLYVSRGTPFAHCWNSRLYRCRAGGVRRCRVSHQQLSRGMSLLPVSPVVLAMAHTMIFTVF